MSEEQGGGRMGTIGAVTIGEAPRADDLVREMRTVLGTGWSIVERGALDGLDAEQIQALAPAPGDYVLVTLRRDGTPVTLGKRAIVPLMQRRIAELEREGVEEIVLLCTGAFPEFAASGLVVLPQETLYALVAALAQGRRIGVLVPLEEQRAQAEQQWRAIGADVTLAVASPYHEADFEQAARQLRAGGAHIAFMDCFGYSLAMRGRVRRALGRPVVLARSAMARIMAELVEGR